MGSEGLWGQQGGCGVMGGYGVVGWVMGSWGCGDCEVMG